jgi:hypothetical protein
MNEGSHGFASGLGIPMGDGHGDFFVATLDHLWQVIATIVDKRIVQAAKRGTRVTSRIFNATGLQEINDHIRAVLGSPLWLGSGW